MKIQPNKVYTISDIVRDHLIPFYRNRLPILKLIENDMNDKNIMEAEIIYGDHPKATKYYIVGKNLKKFLNMFEKGKAFSDMKKHYVKTR